MILSDTDISNALATGHIKVDPLNIRDVQPSSLDVHVASTFRIFHNQRYPFIDPLQQQEELTEAVEVEDGQPFMLHPSEFVLGSTVENITLPNDIAAHLEGKSSLGRLGLLIHSTAGYVDPGFDGTLTLELSNASTMAIAIWPGMQIGHVTFVKMSSPCERPYGHPSRNSKYQHSSGPVASKFHETLDDVLDPRD